LYSGVTNTKPWALRDRGRPPLDDRVLIGGAPRHRGSQGLIEEGHRELAEIEKTSVNAVAFLQLAQNPLRWFLGEATFASAADDHGNDEHV
jgi:hypothetical protein